MNQILHVTGTGVPLLLDDIDTDRIIPARFLRCVSFEGIGEHAFEDDKKQDPSHPFNQPQYASARILVCGRNFGCGSSREHAPQSLMRWGIGAIIAQSYAEIFFGNCTSLGIPAVCADRKGLEQLCKAIEADPTMEIQVNLENSSVHFNGESIPVTLTESARDALVTGRWDFLSQLLENRELIEEKKHQLPYLNGFTGS